MVKQQKAVSPAPLLALAQYLHFNNASDQAISYTQTALQTARDQQDVYWEMRSLSQLGIISRDVFFGSSLRALPYHEQALKIAEARRDTAMIIAELMAIGMNYADAGEQSKSLEYLRRAAVYLQDFQDVRRVLSLWMAITTYLDEPETLAFFSQIRHVSQSMRFAEITRDIDTRIFEMYLSSGQLKQAEAVLLLAANGQRDGSILAEEFYHLAKAKKQPEKALFYLEKAYLKVGEKYLARNTTELSRMETQFGTHEKERVLAEKEILLATNSRQRSWLLIFSAIITLLLGGAIWAYLSEIKLRRMLAEQNAIIESQSVELRKLDELKSRFFANVSHELRTPLTLMLGPVGSLLKRNGTNETDRQLLQFMERNARQLQKLIDEILDLSKLEANKMEVIEEPVLFLPYLKEQLAQFHSFAAGDPMRFDLDYRADESLQVLLDTGKFEKIVHNFLSNAMKFTPVGGAVTLAVETSEHEILLSVADNGQGIHPEDLPFIFDRFYQSKQQDTKIQGGTGIGLSLCKELAFLLEGNVWVESELGLGSTFYFSFPKKAVALAASTLQNVAATAYAKDPILPLQEATAVPPPAGAATVLVVEDNHDLRQYLKFLLSDYQVLTAKNGQEALAILQEAHATSHTPDLIISDLMMPVMDGFELLEHLKSDDRWRHLPVIMLTAKANMRTKLTALRIGVDDYLTKPFEEEELQVRVQNLLDNYRQRIEYFAAMDMDVAETETAVVVKPVMSQVESEWLKTVEGNFAQNLSDRQFNLEWVASQLHLSQRQLNRRLQQLTGLSPNHYLQEMRLQMARDFLLAGKFATVKETAAAVGFRDTPYFSKLFQQHFGIAPSSYLH